jgi:iron-sulfur cluster assembly accessory protein
MITISDSAKTKILDILAEENNPNVALRTFVQGGGCSGFSYGFTLEEEQAEDDFEVPVGSFKGSPTFVSCSFTKPENCFKYLILISKFMWKHHS